MRHYLFILLLIFLPGCGLVSTTIPLQPDTQSELDRNRRNVAALQLKFRSAEAAQTADLPQIRADLQVAESELTAAKSRAVRERVGKGFEYAEVGVKLIGTPLTALLPISGPILTGLVGLIGFARAALTKEK